jgi:hypothetical protein
MYFIQFYISVFYPLQYRWKNNVERKNKFEILQRDACYCTSYGAKNDEKTITRWWENHYDYYWSLVRIEIGYIFKWINAYMYLDIQSLYILNYLYATIKPLFVWWAYLYFNSYKPSIHDWINVLFIFTLCRSNYCQNAIAISLNIKKYFYRCLFKIALLFFSKFRFVLLFLIFIISCLSWQICLIFFYGIRIYLDTSLSGERCP